MFPAAPKIKGSHFQIITRLHPSGEFECYVTGNNLQRVPHICILHSFTIKDQWGIGTIVQLPKMGYNGIKGDNWAKQASEILLN